MDGEQGMQMVGDGAMGGGDGKENELLGKNKK